MLKLYHVEPSPPARACRMVAKAIGVELDLIHVDLLNKAQFSPQFLKLNPTHTVPVLDDNGFIVWDSHAIITYLVDKYGKDDSLYPKDVQKRAIVNQMLYFESGIFFQRLAVIVRPMFYLKEKTIPKEREDAIVEAYNFLDKFLSDKKWVAGDSLTVADLSLVASVTSIDAVCAVNVKKCPNVIKWINRCKELPCYSENIKGVEIFQTLLN